VREREREFFELGMNGDEMGEGRCGMEKKKGQNCLGPPRPVRPQHLASQTAHIAPVRPPGPCRLCTALAQAGNPTQ
jgi:hypothetical protein